MPHEIKGHEFGAAGEQLRIHATDEPGQGGACHAYEISNPSAPRLDNALHIEATINFQNGPVPEFGVNGVTEGALLAIVRDRLQAFQSGPFPCEENKRALDAVCLALSWLKERTVDRVERGIEGELKS